MVWLTVLLGLVLRLINLNQSLWLDEAINTLAVKELSLWQLMTVYPKYDFHPPGYFGLLWAWTKLFGYSEVAVRLPSVIFGVLTIWLVYLIGKKIGSAKLGLMSALLIAINPLHIYYSQEARMYSFAAFAATLNYYFFLKLIKDEKFHRLGYILSILLVFSSDYLAYLIFPSQIIYLLITKNRQRLISWVKLSGVGSIGLILWLPVFLPQLLNGLETSVNTPGWRGVVGSSDLKEVGLTFIKMIIGRISLDDKSVYLSIVGLLGLLFAGLIYRGKDKMLLLWFGVPLVAAWLISLIVPILSYFRLLYLTAPFVLLVSGGLLSFSKRWRLFLLTLSLLIFLSCTSIYLFNPKFHREDWRNLSIFLLQDQKLVLIENSEVHYPLKYYLDDTNLIKPALKKAPANELSDVTLIEPLPTELFLLEYLVDITDPMRLLEESLLDNGYQRIQTYNFRGVGFLHLYKR